MKNMIWKELRENFKWAFLAILGLVLAEFYALSSGSDDSESLTLCSASFLMVTSFGCAAIGAGLGIIQILPELKRDRWASLLHRPVSPGVIFSGKAIAGLILYLFVTGASLLASMAYVAMPGQFAAPYLPVMALPAASDIGLGITFYFAALLLCLHKGRWWGSRGAIAFSVLPVFVLHSTLWGMWFLPLLAAVTFFGAALGSMLSNGRTQNQSRPAHLALVLVFLGGSFAALQGVVSMGQWISIQHQSLNNFTFKQFEVARDGQIFLSSQKGSGSEMTVKDMSGNPVTDERYVGNDRSDNLIQMGYLLFDLENEASLQDSYLVRLPRNLRNYVQPVGNSYDAKERWYCVVAGNYFVGYDKLSLRCVGICDAEGFKPPGSLPKAFPEKLKTSDSYLRDASYYWAGSQLYKIDFSQRSLIQFFQSDGIKIGGVTAIPNSISPDKPSQVVVVMEDGIHLFDNQGRQAFYTPFTQSVGRRVMLLMASDDNLKRVYLQYVPAYWMETRKGMAMKPMVLDVLDDKGKLLQAYEAAGEFTVSSQVGWFPYFSAMMKPLLPAVLNVVCKRIFKPWDINFYDGFGFNFSLNVDEEAWPGLIALDAALGAAIFFWSRQSGFTAGKAAGWAVFSFCFGLPGFLTFLLAVNWPQRVNCPQCGGLRSIEKETCPKCSNEWPLPVKDGTEILVA